MPENFTIFLSLVEDVIASTYDDAHLVKYSCGIASVCPVAMSNSRDTNGHEPSNTTGDEGKPTSNGGDGDVAASGSSIVNLNIPLVLEDEYGITTE